MRLDFSASVWASSSFFNVILSQLVLTGEPLGRHSALHLRRLEILCTKLPSSFQMLMIATTGTTAMEEKVRIHPKKFAQKGNL